MSAGDTETRCRECDFINLADAELCISCAQPLKHTAGNTRTRAFAPLGRHDDTRPLPCPHCTFHNPAYTNVCGMCSKTIHLTSCDDIDNGREENRRRTTRKLECPHCTYVNLNPNNTVCEMCSRKLPTDGASTSTVPIPEKLEQGSTKVGRYVSAGGVYNIMAAFLCPSIRHLLPFGSGQSKGGTNQRKEGTVSNKYNVTHTEPPDPGDLHLDDVDTRRNDREK